MERATDRMCKIVAAQPSKPFLTNFSLLLFDNAGEGLSLDNFSANNPKTIRKN